MGGFIGKRYLDYQSCSPDELISILQQRDQQIDELAQRLKCNQRWRSRRNAQSVREEALANYEANLC